MPIFIIQDGSKLTNQINAKNRKAAIAKLRQQMSPSEYNELIKSRAKLVQIASSKKLKQVS